jgi:hypothetical protein
MAAPTREAAAPGSSNGNAARPRVVRSSVSASPRSPRTALSHRSRLMDSQVGLSVVMLSDAHARNASPRMFTYKSCPMRT